MADLTLVKAALIPMVGENPEKDTAKHIFVQFNPESLKVGLSNSIRADSGSKAASSGVQFIDKSESTLRVTLVFDTSVAREPTAQMSNIKHKANSDVRLLTSAIASEFMQPQSSDEGLTAPKVCRFQWGAFAFVGMLTRFDESLDFFSPEGIPLRATLALSFKENRYQFETLDVKEATRDKPNFFKASDKGVAQSLADNGKDPRDWRLTALLNAIENPRQFTPQRLAENALQTALTPLLNPASFAGQVQGSKTKDPLAQKAIQSRGQNSNWVSTVDIAQGIPNYLAG